MGKLFGTDGVRGVANTELTGRLAYELGRAGAYVLTKETYHTPRILVGMDTRISGDMLESALTAGICSMGAHAVLAGIVPTPAVAYLVRKYKLDAGIVISASHNPVEYNGIKFFNNEGYKLRDELEDMIEEIVLSDKDELPKPTGEFVGTKSIAEDALDDYIDFLTSTGSVNFKAAPIALLNLGAELCIIHNEPNGNNINRNCGSTHIESLCELVKENGADIGFAFDGDADRCLAVDENGEIIDGDKILAICGLYLKEKDRLPGNTVVGTVMSNMGLSVMGNKHGITIEQAGVGDRYVIEKMLEGGYTLGGEQSGHIIFHDYNTTGDGIITAIQMLTVLKERGCKASELAKIMDVYPQVLVNAKIKNENKDKYMENPEVRDAVYELEKKFEGEGRVLIRPSGTEPLVRVMIEGKDIEQMQRDAERLASIIERNLQ